MKLIEKLATDFNCPLGHFESDGCPNCFEAGFRKAMEMAAEQLNKFTVSYGFEGRLLVEGYGIHKFESAPIELGTILKLLGEEEIK